MAAMRIVSRNISHSKFKKKLKRLYNRGKIKKENYEWILFQREIFEVCGESIQAWQYINKEAQDKHQTINREIVSEILDRIAF